MAKIKLFWNNGGRVIIEWGVLITISFWIVNLIWSTGKLVNRIEVLERKTENIEQIQKDISEMKTSINFIKEILQKRYNTN